MADDVDAQWHDALAGLTELGLRRVTVVAMPPPDPTGRVRAGHGAMVTLTGVLGRLIEPEANLTAFLLGAGSPLTQIGTDRLLRVTLDATGVPTINPPANAGDPGNIIRIQLKDPNEILTPDPDDTSAAPGEPA